MATKSSGRQRQNILGLSTTEIPEESLGPPGSTLLLKGDDDCTCSTDSGAKSACGANRSLDPLKRVRRFVSKCEV